MHWGDASDTCQINGVRLSLDQVLLRLPVHGIRVTVFLHAPLNLILLQVLLSLDRKWLPEARRLLRTLALQALLTENVADFIGVGFEVRAIVGVDTDLVVIVVDSHVALIKLLCDINLLTSGWDLIDWRM